MELNQLRCGLFQSFYCYSSIPVVIHRHFVFSWIPPSTSTWMRSVWPATGTPAKLWLKTATRQTHRTRPTTRSTAWSERTTTRSERTLQASEHLFGTPTVISTWMKDTSMEAAKYLIGCIPLWQAVIEAFIKDNMCRSLPSNFRRSVLREFLYKVQQGWDHHFIQHQLLAGIAFDLMFLIYSAKSRLAYL